MKYSIACSCGKTVLATEGDAGSRLQCQCGAEVRVPSLRALRQDAGEPTVSPELVVEQLLLSGWQPEGDNCLACGQPEAKSRTYWIECARAFVKSSENTTATALFVATFFSVLLGWLMLMRRSEGKECGRDVVFLLPAKVCTGCHGELTDAAGIKAILAQVPEYAVLLDKYPNAKVWPGNT